MFSSFQFSLASTFGAANLPSRSPGWEPSPGSQRASGFKVIPQKLWECAPTIYGPRRNKRPSFTEDLPSRCSCSAWLSGSSCTRLQIIARSAGCGPTSIFCLLQQIALNSLMTNRLVSLLKRRWLAGLLAGAIFSALHWPNPVLLPLTFVAGTAMAWMFLCERNILPLAVGQSLLGSLVWWAFPIAWHHMLRVGPGYYAPY